MIARDGNSKRLMARALPWLVAGIVLASCVLAFSYATWWVMRVDGGWYSYPGYAMSEGRDPGENMLAPEDLPIQTAGLRSVFHWENRSFLVTRLYWAWFSIAGHGQTSLVLLGLLEWFGLAGLVALVIYQSTRSRWAAAASAIIALSDSSLIRECLSDLRPDMPIGLVALGSLWFLIRFAQGRALSDILACGLLLALLPLIHTTGVLPMAMLLTCIGLLGLASVHGAKRSSGVLLCAAVILGALAVFALRQPILDVLVPTHVPLSLELTGRHDLIESLREMYGHGLAWKAREELHRWTSYFLPGNLGQFLFLCSGLIVLATKTRQSAPSQTIKRMLLLGWIVGMLSLTLLDSHFTFAHLIPLVCLGYALAGIGWAGVFQVAREDGGLRWVPTLFAIVVITLGLKVAQAANVLNKGMHEGVSRQAVRALLEQALPAQGVTWVIAPTSVWLYAPSGGTPVLIDRREDTSALKSAIGKRVSVLIVDSDFLEFGWADVVKAGLDDGTLTPIGRVGAPDSGIYYIEAFAVHPSKGS